MHCHQFKSIPTADVILWCLGCLWTKICYAAKMTTIGAMWWCTTTQGCIIYSLCFYNSNIVCVGLLFCRCVLVHPREGGGLLSEDLGGVCGALLETLSLFQTKICDFPYPISDLTQNLIPYFRPDPNPISSA